MITKKGLVFLLLLSALFLVGINIQAGWIFVLVSFLSSTFLFSFFLPPLFLRKVELKRETPSKGFEGEKIPITLKVINKGGLKVLLEYSDQFLDQQIHLPIPFLKKKGKKSWDYSIKASRRGFYQGSYATLKCSAPFGFFLWQKRFYLPSPLLIYPSYFEIRTFPLLETASYPAEVIHERKKGSGSEYYGTREYAPGDSLRFIHWKNTAKKGKMIVKEFERGFGSLVNILIDSNSNHNLGEGKESTLEYSIKIGTSLINYSLKTGHPIQLIASKGKKIEVLSYPDWWQALEWLSRLEAEGDLSFPDLVKLSLPYLPPRSTLICLIPTLPGLNLSTFLLAQESKVRIINIFLKADTFTKGRRVLEKEAFDKLLQDLSEARILSYVCQKSDDICQSLNKPF